MIVLRIMGYWSLLNWRVRNAVQDIMSRFVFAYTAINFSKTSSRPIKHLRIDKESLICCECQDRPKAGKEMLEMPVWEKQPA